MLRTTDAAARSCAMNYGCWYAIVRSEKTHTLARNEFQVLMCHHAVRKDTHAGLQRILRHAMNYGCGSAIVTWIQASKHKNITILNTWIYQHNITIPSVILKELVVCGGCNEWRLLIRHRAVRKDTRWPATNASACNELLARNEFQVLMCHHAVRKDTHAGLQRMLRHAMNYGCGTQPVLTREFCQKKTHQHANLLQHGMEFRVKQN